MLPLRVIFESLGAYVEWDQKEKTGGDVQWDSALGMVTIKSDSKTINVKVNKPEKINEFKRYTYKDLEEIEKQFLLL